MRRKIIEAGGNGTLKCILGRNYAIIASTTLDVIEDLRERDAFNELNVFQSELLHEAMRRFVAVCAGWS